MTLLERLDERWERMDGAAATKIDRILKDRREASKEIKRLRAVLTDLTHAKEPPENPQPDDIDWRFVALEMKRVATINLKD